MAFMISKLAAALPWRSVVQVKPCSYSQRVWLQKYFTCIFKELTIGTIHILKMIQFTQNVLYYFWVVVLDFHINLLFISHSSTTAVFLRILQNNTTCTQLLPQRVCFLFHLLLLFCSMQSCLQCSGKISLPQKYKIKNVCNLRVLVESGEEQGKGARRNLTVF